MKNKMLRYLEYILPKFKDTFFRLTFSIDGIGDNHDENRSMKGSFNKIIDSYKVISPLKKKYNNLPYRFYKKNFFNYINKNKKVKKFFFIKMPKTWKYRKYSFCVIIDLKQN